MTPDFEIKYIEVQWYDKHTVTGVKESQIGLNIEHDSQLQCFQCETTIYPNAEGLRGQLAVRFIKQFESEPYVDMPDGSQHMLSPIEDSDTGKTWWVVKDTWDRHQKYWKHTGINTAGTLRLVLNNQQCDVLIGSVQFTREQLETYLDCFKDDVWELILDESSYIQANTQSSVFEVNEGIIESISNLIHHAEKVLGNLKVELRETQALKLRKAVKPVTRTFMEIATKSNQRVLTSRATVPSYNVSENRYVLFVLERCSRIVRQIVKLSENKSRRYRDQVSKLNEQHDSLTGTIKVDKELVEKDLSELAQKRYGKYWQQQLAKKMNDNGVGLYEHAFNHSSVYLRLENITDNNDGFFVLLFNIHTGNWERCNGKSTIVKFDDNSILECLIKGADYKVTGLLETNTYKRLELLTFWSVSNIEFINSEMAQKCNSNYSKEKSVIEYLSANNWMKKLSPSELEDQKREKRSLRNRIEYYEEQWSQAEYVFQKVGPKLSHLMKIIKNLRNKGIKPSSYFPNSMTFVQNPHYQGVHAAYRVLREAANLTDDDLLISLEEIQKIGLVNTPLLYERWCLLQIMKVLTDTYRYVPEGGWKYKLINAVLSNEVDIEFSYSNEKARRNIKLTYEKQLINRKRPDFVIDLEWSNYNEEDATELNFKRFVLDAKFYNESTFTRQGGLIGVAQNLYYNKDYSEGEENPVFVMHPCETTIKERVSSQNWGKYSYLGEMPMHDIESSPNHQYGGIYLNPIDRELYSDELQRLIGLFLQYKLEDPITKSESRGDLTKSVPFCIRCGSTDLIEVAKSAGYTASGGRWKARTPRSVWMECSECKQFISFNHCQNTGTRLIKNGIYWTYHSARAIEPFNSKCPSCGEWGSW